MGHWADQIIGAHNRSVLWLTEHVTRFSIPVTMPEGYEAAMLAGLVEGLDQIPEHLLASITFDRDPMATADARRPTDGCGRTRLAGRSPRTSPAVEVLVPRGTDLSIVDRADAQHTVIIINGQRRRGLDYHSPASLYADLTVH